MPSTSAQDKLAGVAGILAAATLLAGLAGCSSTRRYSAGSLPAELRAPLIENAQIVDLSQFTGPPIGNDLIDYGDLLEVSIAASIDGGDLSTFLVRVRDDGMAVLPDVGPIPLAGLHLMQAEGQIAAACVQRQLYRRPHVTVAMNRQRANRVTVVGGVEEPGVCELPRGSSYLAAAIMAAGGLAEEAGTQVRIQQPAPPARLASGEGAYPGPSGVQLTSNTTAAPGAPARVVSFSLMDAGGYAGEYLRDGSVVTIERQQPDPIWVMGLVGEPGQYDFPVKHGVNVLAAVAQAGGLSSKLADSILVIREDPNGQGSATIAVSYQRAKGNARENLRLMPGDIVTVQETPATVALDIAYRVIRIGIGGNLLF